MPVVYITYYFNFSSTMMIHVNYSLMEPVFRTYITHYNLYVTMLGNVYMLNCCTLTSQSLFIPIVELSKTQRNAPKLLYEGFSYVIDNRAKEQTYWRL